MKTEPVLNDKTSFILCKKEYKAKTLKNKRGVFVLNGNIIAKSSVYDEAIFVREALGMYCYGDITWHREDKIRFKSL